MPPCLSISSQGAHGLTVAREGEGAGEAKHAWKLPGSQRWLDQPMLWNEVVGWTVSLQVTSGGPV